MRRSALTWLGTPQLLIAAYILAVFMHVWLLSGVWIAPYIAHDEVQYCLIGENIRAGHGFTMRGGFASTAPPLFPLFVALGHSLLPNPREGLFFASVLVICTMLFPAFLIGRDLGLTRFLAAGAALAATLSPTTFYAGMYMSEILQLPLLLLAVWLCLRWLRTGGFKLAAMLGLAFGLMTLNRFASLTFVLCFLATALVAVAAPQRFRVPSTRLRLLASLAIVIGAVTLFQGGWWAYKLAHHVSALGAYSDVSSRWGHPSLNLFFAYLADAFIAPGIIVAAPFVVGLRRLYREQPSSGLLLSIVVFVLVCSTALSDGSLTGFLRERYFIYCFPLIAIVAILGAEEYFKTRRLWIAAAALAAFPLICLFGVLLYDFHVAALVEVTWAHAVGAFSLAKPSVFDRTVLLRNGIVLIVLVSMILIAGRRVFAAILLGYVLLFNLYALARVGRDISVVTNKISADVSPLLSLLPPTTRTLQRVVIAGAPPPWDSPSVPTVPRFIEASAAQLPDDTIWYLETMKLLDVRMCPTPYCVFNPDFAGAYMISTVQFPNLDLVKSNEPFNLYRIPRPPSGRPMDGERTFIGAGEFTNTALTTKTPVGTVAGRGVDQEGVLVFGPYRKLNRGVYEVTPVLEPTTERLSIEVVQDFKVLEVEDTPSNQVSLMLFVADPAGTVEFRISGLSRKDFIFKGVELRSLSADWRLAAVEYVIDFPARQFFTKVGSRMQDGSLRSTGGFGFLCYGPYVKLPAGKYRIKFKLRSSGNVNVRADVVTPGSTLASADGPANQFPSLEFASNGKTLLEFRVIPPNGSDVIIFSGVELVPIQ